MFRKLVSTISFSPALVAQMSHYATQLRKEEVTRRVTIIFTILALIVQSLVVFSPPESANASSEQDLIRGGVRSLEELLVQYDKNTDDIRDIYTTAGLTRAELAAATPTVVTSNDPVYIMSRFSQLDASQGGASFTYKRSAGGTGTRYVTPLRQIVTPTAPLTYDAWVGESDTLGWFAVLKPSASLAVTRPLAQATPAHTTPVQYTLTAHNASQANQDAEIITAQAFDKIRYSATARNTTATSAPATLSIHIGDVLEYSRLVDLGGGIYEPESKTLTWPLVQLDGREVQQRTFVVQLYDDIPTTAAGASNPASYDCIMAAAYGTQTRVAVDCPATKRLEAFLASLPATGMTANFLFAGSLLTLVVFFYLRARLLKKEIRLIRHNLNTGII